MDAIGDIQFAPVDHIFIAIAYRIYIDFDPVFKEEVEQNLIVRQQLEDVFHILIHFLLVDGDSHAAVERRVQLEAQLRHVAQPRAPAEVPLEKRRRTP